MAGWIASPDVFPEVPGTLKRLKAAGLKTAILSNGSPDMLDAAVNKAGIGDLLDAVLSVELVDVYKPHPEVYQLAVDRVAVPAEMISFQSSNAWDAYAASAFGMRVVWCNRYGQQPERLPGRPHDEIASLAELPTLVWRLAQDEFAGKHPMSRLHAFAAASRTACRAAPLSKGRIATVMTESWRSKTTIRPVY